MIINYELKLIGEPLWPGKSDVDQLHLIRLTLGIFFRNLNSLHVNIDCFIF